MSIRLGLVVLGGLLAAVPASAQNAARVLSAQGVVEREQPPWARVAINSWLPTGTRVRTGDQSRAVLLLIDETQLKINANSELQLAGVRGPSTIFTRLAAAANRSQESVLNLSKGQVWLRARNKPADVRVSTPAVTAAIRGTEFDLRVGADGESRITVLEGSVDFRNDLGAVLVNSGEQGLARVGQAPTKTVLVNPTDAVQWTLAYSGAVSPRDFPFRFASAAAARLALAAASPGLELAETRHDAGDREGALAALAGLATPDAAERRGWILLEQNRLAEALAEFDRADAGAVRVRLGRARTLYRLGRFGEAYQQIQDGIDSHLVVQRAQFDLLAGDAAAARDALEALAPGDPAFAQGQALLSNVYLVQNRKDDSRQAADRALRAAPESPTAYLARSLVEQSAFDLDGATRSAAQARALDPSFVQANVQHATLLFGAGKTEAAGQAVRAVLAASPGEAAAHSVLGFIQLAEGRADLARTSFDTSLGIDSTQGEPHLGLGILAMRAGQNDDAVTEFLTAATLEPRRSLYQSYLAKALYELRRFDQAFEALTAAERLDERDPTPHLYAGIFRNDLIEPGVAVREFNESIRLTDGRAVFRSRFLLDEDRATRNVSLSAAYARLGLSEWANFHATAAEAADPASSSTHLFLAGTDGNLKGRLSAQGGELLISRLLMPVNANSFNAFNNYTTLFDRPRANGAVTGLAGTFSTGAAAGNWYGGTNRIAYSAGWNYFRSDGFRPVNDDRHDTTGANLFKAALTPHSDLLLTYIHSHSRQGDHGGGSGLIGDLNNPNLRVDTRLDRGEVGFHQRIRPGSDLLVFFAADAHQIGTDDPQKFRGIVDEELGLADEVVTNRSSHASYQAAHLVKLSKLQLRYGVDIHQGHESSETVDTYYLPLDLVEQLIFFHILPRPPAPSSNDVRYRTVFAQSHYPLAARLTVSGGVNYDWANNDNAITFTGNSMAKWNPHVGVVFNPIGETRIRVAAMSVLQTHLQDRLAPTQVAGFVFNQNEPPLSQSTGYNVGWDQPFGSRTFFRAMAFTRERLLAFGGFCDVVECQGRTTGGQAVLNQFLTDRWTVVPEYSQTRTSDYAGFRHDREINIGTFFVHPSGFSFGVTENHLHQRGYTGETPVDLSVFTTNASFSYELPNKRGLLSLTASNLTGRRYAFLADPLALDSRVPKRQATLSVRVYF